MIQVSHLTKYYGDFLAVNDLSFEIQVGHVYGFLGPNGAGKSTTMNIMTVLPSCRLFGFYAFLNSIECFLIHQRFVRIFNRNPVAFRSFNNSFIFKGSSRVPLADNFSKIYRIA